VTKGSILGEDLLLRCRERAAGYDRDNRFAQEDFDELKEAGYLRMALPKEFGGAGLRLADAARETRRLAGYAPATALAVNMHTYWVGLCADLHRAGDSSLDWLLEEAGRGEVFAAGHAESGNDLPVLLSTTRAEPVDGGYRFSGRKSFGSLTPVWTRLGLHGLDASDPERPRIVHAFVPRDADGVTIKETWDVMGMRATRSDDTLLDGVFVPRERVVRIVPPGAAGLDAFVLGIFAWALLAFGNVYYGLARRILELTVESLKGKQALGLTRTMIHHPAVQHGVAEMVLELEAMGPHVESVAQDWSATDEHGPEFVPRVVAAKHHCVTSAWRVADLGLDLSGGFGMFKKNELERLFRDARAGRFHPANPALTHEILAKTTLGIDLDEAPRWG